MKNENTSDPMVHVSNVKSEFASLIQHLREDISKMEDRSAKALFETSAEVLTGLTKAFSDFETKSEPAWK
jgi:hypothetical protein